MKKNLSVSLILALLLNFVVIMQASAVLLMTPYTCFTQLSFDDPANLPSRYPAAAAIYHKMNDPEYPAYSGGGAFYIDGTTAGISIWSGRSGTGITTPAVGDAVAGYYYFKRMEENPGDKKIPLVRLYTGKNEPANYFCVTENPDMKVADLPLNQWVKIDMISTGRVFEQTDNLQTLSWNISADSKYKFMIDEVKFCRIDGDSNAGVTVRAVPEFTPYEIPNSDFEFSSAEGLAANWGRYTTNKAAVTGSPDAVKHITTLNPSTYDVAPEPQSGYSMVEVVRGGNFWNIFSFGTTGRPKPSERIGGYFWLYVPAGADLARLPVVNVNIMSEHNPAEKTISTSDGYSTEKIVLNAWNKIPILPISTTEDKGIIPADITRINYNVIAKPRDNGTVNPLYDVPFYVDNIQCGSLADGVRFSSQSTLCDANWNAIDALGGNDTDIYASALVYNPTRDADIHAKLLMPLYQNGKLVKVAMNDVVIQKRGIDGFQSTYCTISASLSGISKTGLTAKLLLWEEDITPVCEPVDILSEPVEEEETFNVLFVGNSYTYYNDLPVIFKTLAESGGHSVYQESSTSGGYKLVQHADPNDPVGSITLRKITDETKNWDYVILQGNSSLPITDPITFATGVSSLATVINQSGANVALYQTPGHKMGDVFSGINYTFEDESEILKTQYSLAAINNNALLLPAGDAWLKLKQDYPAMAETGLWHDDNSHPQYRGSYMNACVFYAKFFNESPVGLYYDTALMSEQEAQIVQTTAALVCGIES